MGSLYRRGSKGCGGTVAISWLVPGTPTSRPGPRPRPHALVNLLPTSSRRGAHLFCASLARVSSVPPTLCRTVSPTFGSKFIPCGTALLSARLRILVPCYLEATPAPLLFSGSREDKQSRPPERSQRPRSRRGKETATSIVLKGNTVAPKMTTTKKTEARPYCNGSRSFSVN